ncbi:YdbH domain-containing protein [Shewanella pneumatophori]|uniref:YdbH domain-containing protein n=1 Tax=Shewanella pneumatophori TaxID=314092 RepID=A0A9X2CG42_9GAMM|nr:YdbH domain-containing protein [Shewanella pneumatophori]MCL1137074.1 YdbH domain-containing protein [Shewanella pneumatophori]
MTIELANQYLSAYNTQIHQLSFAPKSFTQWQIASALISVDNTDIRLTDLNLMFDENTQPWAFEINDLLALSVERVDVALSPSALWQSSSAAHATGPAVGLNFDSLPDIKVNHTHLTLKGINESELSVDLQNLSLNKLRQLQSQIYINNKPLLTLSADLNETEWRASSNIDLTLLQAFSRQLAQSEQLLLANKTNVISGTNEVNHNHQYQSLLAPLYELVEKIDDKHIQLHANLDSRLKLNLKTAQISSQHRLSQASLVFDDFEQTLLRPMSLDTSEKKQHSSSGLSFDISGHITEPTLTVEPFSLPLRLDTKLSETDPTIITVNSDERLKNLLQKLNDKPFEQALLNLYQQLSLDNSNIDDSNIVNSKPDQAIQSPNLLINLAQGLSYKITENKLHIPAVSIELKDSKLRAVIAVNDLHYHLDNANSDYLLKGDWHIEASHNQALTLNRLWPSLNKLPYQVNFNQSEINLSGDLSAGQTGTNTDFNIQIKSGAQQTSKGIELIQPDLPQSANSTSLKAHSTATNTLHIDQTKLLLDSPVEYRFSMNANSDYFSASKQLSMNQLSIPAFSYQVSGLSSNIVTNNELEEQYALKVASIGFNLQAPTKLILRSFTESQQLTRAANAKTYTKAAPLSEVTAQQNQDQAALNLPLTQQLLSHKLSNQIAIDISNVRIDKSGYNRPLEPTSSSRLHGIAEKNKPSKLSKRRHIKQKLAEFDEISLLQVLALNKQTLQTNESWQINDLNLTSQHQLAPQHNIKYFSLAGDWQFSSEFAPILAFLSQTDSLPESLDIQGNAEFAMHYELEKNQQLAFAASLIPQVKDITGSINNLPFEGGNMDTQCNFNWQQNSDNKRKSEFNCDNIALSLLAFNPGVLITDINAEAAVNFATESQTNTSINQTPTLDPKAAEQQTSDSNNLALAKQLLGVKQASFALTAQGDLLGGQLLIPQFELNLKQPSSAYFVLQQIDLEQLLAIQPQVGVYATGIFDGVLPVNLDNGKASVIGGKLAARAPGGLIAIGNNPAVEQMRQSQPYLEFAFSTLEHLNYSELSSTFDMNALGDAILKVNVKGRSRGMERPIHFNYSQEENMLQLLRSLQIGDNLQNQIERAVK